MNKVKLNDIPIKSLNIPLERDLFTRSLIRELSGLLEEMIGLDEAEGFISVVGQRIGAEIEGYYKEALDTQTLSKEQIADVLVDLKDRIQGEFHVIELTEEKIVFGNTRCPFGEKVKDRPSLCMMTSNVFGTITADNNGYAKVALEKTIAQGDMECRVTVFLNNTTEACQTDGREYYSGD